MHPFSPAPLRYQYGGDGPAAPAAVPPPAGPGAGAQPGAVHPAGGAGGPGHVRRRGSRRHREGAVPRGGPGSGAQGGPAPVRRQPHLVPDREHPVRHPQRRHGQRPGGPAGEPDGPAAAGAVPSGGHRAGDGPADHERRPEPPQRRAGELHHHRPAGGGPLRRSGGALQVRRGAHVYQAPGIRPAAGGSVPPGGSPGLRRGAPGHPVPPGGEHVFADGQRRRGRQRGRPVAPGPSGRVAGERPQRADQPRAPGGLPAAARGR